MSVTAEQIERANLVNLPDFLKGRGFALKRVGREYVLREHDSLHIKDNAVGERGKWFRFSTNEGGNNIQFVEQFMGLSFTQAVEMLNEEKMLTVQQNKSIRNEPSKKREIVIHDSADQTRLMHYLHDVRHLSAASLEKLVDAGKLSQEETTGNAVFHIFDENGVLVGAEKIGTSENRFKLFEKGSASGYGFEITKGNPVKTYFFESAVDAVSFADLFPERNDYRLVSMAGVKPSIVEETMKRYGIPQENVYLCTDNDQAGNAFADKLTARYPNMKRLMPQEAKDWNDILRGRKSKMKQYGNTYWQEATDNRDKTVAIMREDTFQQIADSLDRSGLNYCAYSDGKNAMVAVNSSEIERFKTVTGLDDSLCRLQKSNKEHIPDEMNVIGNTEYKYIPQKSYISEDRETVLKMAELANKSNISFSARVYPSGKATMTVSQADLQKMQMICDDVKAMRKPMIQANRQASQEIIGNKPYREIRNRYFLVSQLTPEKYHTMEQQLLERGAQFSGLIRDRKVMFTVEEEQAQQFHAILRQTICENKIHENLEQMGLEEQQIQTLASSIEIASRNNMANVIENYVSKDYDISQLEVMDHLLVSYLGQNDTSRFLDNGKQLELLLNAKQEFDLQLMGQTANDMEQQEPQEVMDFRAKTDEHFHFHDYRPQDIEELAQAFVENVFSENDVTAEIHGAAIIGSRSRGLEKENSDIDVVIEIDSDLKEDALFNIIHDEPFTLEGVTIDVNPIRADETGTLETYLPTAESYLTEKAQHRELSDLDIAKQHIADYFERELFGDPAEFSDISRISLAYAVDEEHNFPIQVYADLEQFRLTFEYDGTVVRDEQYNSLAEMNENTLSVLDYNDLVSLSDDEISSVIQVKAVEQLHSKEGIKATDLLSVMGVDVVNMDEPEPTEEKENDKESELFSQLFTQAEKADFAKFIAKDALSSDEWEGIAYPLFENGYVENHKPNEKWIFGSSLHELELFDIASRYHNGEDIRKELAIGLIGHRSVDDFKFVLEDNGAFSERTYQYPNKPKQILHAEYGEDSVKLSFKGMEREVTYAEIGQAFLDRTLEEYNDLAYWRVLDYIKDDIPDISDNTVKDLLKAFDDATLPDWEKGDNQAKINRIKKVLYDVLGDEEQTEKAFACIAKHKYNVTFEEKEPEIHKPYHVVTNAGLDGGIDEKLEYATLEEAITAGKAYLADDYLGFAVLNHDTKEIERVDGDFSIQQAFGDEILRINGIVPDEIISEQEEATYEQGQQNEHEKETKKSELPFKVGDSLEFDTRQYVVNKIDVENNNIELRDDNTGWYPMFQKLPLDKLLDEISRENAEEIQDVLDQADKLTAEEKSPEEVSDNTPLFDESVIADAGLGFVQDDRLSALDEKPQKFEQLSLFGGEEMTDESAPESHDASPQYGEPVTDVNRFEQLHKEIMRGSGFEGGKFRIAEFFEKNSPSSKDLADFMKKEYGTGGHSGDDEIASVDHDSHGLHFTTRSVDGGMSEEKFDFTWNQAASLTADLIKHDKYITQDDIDRHVDHAKFTIENFNPEYDNMETLVRAKAVLEKYAGAADEQAAENKEIETEQQKADDTETYDFKAEYRQLSRLQSDCDYFLGNGAGHEKHLSCGSVENQIARMQELWDGFPDGKKPEWLSKKDIDGYAEKMIAVKNGEIEIPSLFTVPTKEDSLNSDKSDTFKIEDESLGEGGLKSKFKANIAAIETLKTLEAENRTATAEEKQTMSRYVGWGGLANAFDENKSDWANEFAQLKSLLTEDEYNSARASTLNAFYTTPTVIDSIYSALESFDFKGSNVLEPSCGVGNFIGRMPQEMRENSNVYGVELDSLTGRLAKAIYTEADIQVKGFEKTEFQNGCFDVAVGNVPFGDLGFTDKTYGTSKLHDFFFAQTLDKVKEGGIVAFVTSTGTLDKQDDRFRKQLAEKADLIGAIRLPNTAFKANANTEVTSDIIFLKKNTAPDKELPDWVNLGKTENGLSLNKYFADHPDMVLGNIVDGNKLYGKRNGTMVTAHEGADLKTELQEAVSKLSAQISNVKTSEVFKFSDKQLAVTADELRPFSFFEDDKRDIYLKGGTDQSGNYDVTKVMDTKSKDYGRMSAFIEMRDTVRELLKVQAEDRPEKKFRRVSRSFPLSTMTSTRSMDCFTAVKIVLFCGMTVPTICFLRWKRNLTRTS